VSNVPTATPQEIVQGNERVLRARLSDAQFFFQQDKKTKLEDRVEKLGNVVYHNKLGSQLQRVKRLQKLSGEIARMLNADVAQAQRAAYLCKADLLTDMVGEFPELQGIMGRYYALNDGEQAAVADAIQNHYLPKGGSDVMPKDKISISVSLADKLDTLVGIYGIGLIPSGDKDPFGLRRAALGILSILFEETLPLDLLELLQFTKNQFPPGVLAESVVTDLHGFMLERLKNYLREKDYAPDEIEAVISKAPTSVADILLRLNALREFRNMSGYANLIAASKRIRNILKGLDPTVGAVSSASDDMPPAEQSLRAAIYGRRRSIEATANDYPDYLTFLSGLYLAIDKFFEDVMILDSDLGVRNSRVSLVRDLNRLFNIVADLSKLQPK
jgi:glycyl-tRNA synthetase beta chain